MSDAPRSPQRLLKISPQGQVTLPVALWQEIGRPSHVVAEYVNPNLILKPAWGMTLAEAEARFRKEGITAEVLKEALRIVDRKARERAAKAGAGEQPAS